MRRQLRLNNIHNTRTSFAGLIRRFYRNEDEFDTQDLAWWRVLSGMMSELVKAHKVEKDLEIEKGLEAVEKILRERGKE